MALGFYTCRSIVTFISTSTRALQCSSFSCLDGPQKYVQNVHVHCKYLLYKYCKCTYMQVSPCNGLERLVLQLSRLQKDHVALEGRYEQVSAELRHVQSEKENLHDELMMTKDMPFKLKVKIRSIIIALSLHIICYFAVCGVNSSIAVFLVVYTLMALRQNLFSETSFLASCSIKSPHPVPSKPNELCTSPASEGDAKEGSSVGGGEAGCSVSC